MAETFQSLQPFCLTRQTASVFFYREKVTEAPGACMEMNAQGLCKIMVQQSCKLVLHILFHSEHEARNLRIYTQLKFLVWLNAELNP